MTAIKTIFHRGIGLVTVTPPALRAASSIAQRAGNAGMLNDSVTYTTPIGRYADPIVPENFQGAARQIERLATVPNEDRLSLKLRARSEHINNAFRALDSNFGTYSDRPNRRSHAHAPLTVSVKSSAMHAVGLEARITESALEHSTEQLVRFDGRPASAAALAIMAKLVSAMKPSIVLGHDGQSALPQNH